ncbi:MAG: hypothetical protein LH469_08750 [Frankiaceae bacterium]|nr:hypothetical protein [Frankiaceae bacterium]
MRVRVIPASAADLSTSVVFDPRPGQTYAGPAFRGDGLLVLARQPVQTAAGSDAVGVVLDPSDGSAREEFALSGRVVEQDYDSTGTYLLTLHDDGTVHWQGAGTDGTLQIKGAMAAAW